MKKHKKNNIDFSFKCFDAIIFIVAIFITVASAVIAYNRPQNHDMLSIGAPDGEYVYTLDKDRIVDVKGLIGVSVIEIVDGSARFVSSPCDNNVCISHGFLAGRFDFVACLPNGIFMKIGGDSDSGEVDAIAQ